VSHLDDFSASQLDDFSVSHNPGIALLSLTD
jgi:hypothetical protein